MPRKPFKPRKVEIVEERQGVNAKTRKVNVETLIGGKFRRVPMIEKVLINQDSYYTYRRFSAGLRRLGVRAVRVRLIETESGTRCFLPDLTRGGKFKVVEFEDPTGGLTQEAKGLSNFAEVSREIAEQTQRASMGGFEIQDRAWLIVVNPKTNKGVPWVVDFKQVDNPGH